MSIASVSVVVPARNAARTLGAQLSALTRQSIGMPYEIVVVDNASADDTAAIVRRHGTDAAIEVVHCAEVGISRARNRGVLAARGESVLFCDADDEVSSDWIARMQAALAHLDVVGGRIDLSRLNPAWARSSRLDPTREGLPVGFGFLPYGLGANIGFRRAAFDALGGFDGQFQFGAEEIDFCWRAQYAGFRLGFVPEAVVHYRLKTVVGARFRQFRGYALGNARLYAKHRALGRLPRQSRRQQAGMIRDHLRRVARPAFLADPGRRLHHAADAGWFLGAIEGWVRHRVVV